jgi:hypothetical protein
VRTSFAFAGAAYAWPYYCGVAAFVQRHRLLHDEARCYSASAGGVAALFLTAGIDADHDGFETVVASNDAHYHPRLGPWLRPEKAQHAFFEVFGQCVPADAHLRASGRLHILVTQLVPVLRRRVVSHFASRDALLAALAASMALPGHGVHVAFRSPALDLGWCLDGGIFGSLKDDERPDWPTVRVSVLPFAHRQPLKRIDICPVPGVSWRQMLIIGSREERRALHERGYEDAGRYFDRAELQATG